MVEAVMSWNKSVVVVSGASRGYGAVVCELLSGRLAGGSVLLGMARSREGLCAVQQAVVTANAGVTFIPLVVDLSAPDMAAVQKALQDAFSRVGASSLQEGRPEGVPCSTAVMVHNAGSVGAMRRMERLQDWNDIKLYFDFNISSVYTLNAAFLSHAKTLKDSCPDLKIEVVNVSSLCAVTPMRSWSLYCAGKAARDMAFRVLAMEEPGVTVLNYAPGPLDTDMQKEVREETEDLEMRTMFCRKYAEGELLSPHQSAEKMLALLHEGNFKSGDHVDYYDI